MILFKKTSLAFLLVCFSHHAICSSKQTIGVFEPISPTDDDLFQRLKVFFHQQNAEARQELLRLRSDLQQINLQQRVSQQTLDIVQQQMQHVRTEIHELTEKSPFKDQWTEPFRSGRMSDGRVGVSESTLSTQNKQQTTLQRISDELLDALPAWQQRMEAKLTKIMNVAAEIYKEDKQLSQTLARLNNLPTLQQGSDDQPDSGATVRKTLQEELSVVRAELRNQFSIVERQCASDREQHENVTFLVLGLKDDLLTQTSKLCKNSHHRELSILDEGEDDSSGKDARETHAPYHQPLLPDLETMLNKSVSLLRDEMQRMHFQLVTNLQREHREAGDRLILWPTIIST